MCCGNVALAVVREELEGVGDGPGGQKVRRLGWGHCWGAAGGREVARGQSSTRHVGKSLG